MKNNHKALAAAVCLTLLAAGCAPKREAVSSAPAPPEKEIRWLLALEGAAYPKEWESYEVLAAISEKAGVTPVLEPLNENYAPALLKRLQSGERPALITLAAADPVCLQMEHISSVRRIDAIPALFEQLPEDIRAFHQQADGSLLYLPGGFGVEAAVPAEGIYVREDMFDTLGRPGLTDENGFFAALEAYDSWYGRNRDETKTNYLPVVFGTNRRRHPDAAALVRLDTGHRGSGRRGGAAALSGAAGPRGGHLRRAGNPRRFPRPSSAERGTVLHRQRFAARTVQPGARGHALSPRLAAVPGRRPCHGRLPYGCYATYLCAADADLGDTVRLARYLLSKEGSRTAMLGAAKPPLAGDGRRRTGAVPRRPRPAERRSGYAEKTGIGGCRF